jgi:23S rRNA pseudouridine1911/1915/1917 synthase
MVSFVVGEEDADQRLDRALAAVAGIPRSRARRWIDEGRVELNDRRARPSQRVAVGDVLHAQPPAPIPSAVVPQDIALRVLYEDEDVIVIDKPAGLVVHPGPGHPDGTLVNALLHHCGDLAGIGGVLRPGIVHRLDRGTSGVMIAAKHDDAHLALAVQFRDHRVERVYIALVRGTPGEDAGRIELPIGRHRRDRKRMSVSTSVARQACTAWTVRRRLPASGTALLDVQPETGRTHQIRVHLAAAGLPIVGDLVYGRGKGKGFGIARPALHAAVLGFDHPRSQERLRFEAPLPPDFEELLENLTRREAARE